MLDVLPRRPSPEGDLEHALEEGEVEEAVVDEFGKTSTATALARHPPFHTVTVRSIENSTPIASQNGNHTQVSIAKIMSRISAK